METNNVGMRDFNGRGVIVRPGTEGQLDDADAFLHVGDDTDDSYLLLHGPHAEDCARIIKGMIDPQSHISIDAADIKGFVGSGCVMHYGSGYAMEPKRSAEQAMENVLGQGDSTESVRILRALINVTCASDALLGEVMFAVHRVTDAIDPDAQVIWGLCFDDSVKIRHDGCRFEITVILAE